MADDTDQDERATLTFMLGQLYALTMLKPGLLEQVCYDLDEGHRALVNETGRRIARASSEQP